MHRHFLYQNIWRIFIMNKKINTCDELLARLESLNGETKQVKTGMQSTPAYNRTFWDFMRDGMPRNALKENSDGAGGYLVPDEYELKLVSALENENHLRRISNVIQTRHTWAEWVIVRFYPNQQHLRTRNTIVEHPYGTVKRWHGASYLLTKGKVKVAAETGLSFLAYNFRRVINLLGVSKTISLIQA
jgi:hypothetical protein